MEEVNGREDWVWFGWVVFGGYWLYAYGEQGDECKCEEDDVGSHDLNVKLNNYYLKYKCIFYENKYIMHMYAYTY